MKSIVLTGISRGLGKALHDQLLSTRFSKTSRIFISRKIENKLDGNHISYINLDLAGENIDIEKILIPKSVDSIVFISNAGVIKPIDIALKLKISDIKSSLRVNCLSPLRIAQHLTHIAEKIGVNLLIINISSGAASKPIQGWLAYCVSKASAKMAFDVLAAENSHVAVIHFDPGVMDTDMQNVIRNQTDKSMPDVKIFQDYKLDKKLNLPCDVAMQIIDRMEGFKQ